MNKQLIKDTNDIRNLIFSFTIAKLQKELSESSSLSRFSESGRILVIASGYSLDNFVKGKKKDGFSIREINERCFMCNNLHNFKNNILFFREVIATGWENSNNDSGFDIRADQILEFNRKAIEIHSPHSTIHISGSRF